MGGQIKFSLNSVTMQQALWYFLNTSKVVSCCLLYLLQTFRYFFVDIMLYYMTMTWFYQIRPWEHEKSESGLHGKKPYCPRQKSFFLVRTKQKSEFFSENTLGKNTRSKVACVSVAGVPARTKRLLRRLGQRWLLGRKWTCQKWIELWKTRH